MAQKNNTGWDEKKIQILNVSREIFARFGFSKSTMDDIARAMGMKKGSLYYYYKSKEDIIRDVIRFESEHFLKALKEEMSGLRTIRRKVHFFLQFRLERFKQAFNLHRMSIQAFLEVKPMVLSLYKDYFEKEVAMLAGIIKAGIKEGQFVQLPVKRVARALLTYSDAIHFQELQKNPAVSISGVDYEFIKKEVQFLTDIVLNGITLK